jgi:hypothetical protein
MVMFVKQIYGAKSGGVSFWHFEGSFSSVAQKGMDTTPRLKRVFCVREGRFVI